ncbi:bifunctional 5,10-methylenetetrahydrofolate dehydrogenase/5,10-methenyltetrahydrofolate cyclohydrolase [Candidatus Uhrbacteria bacterium]|nr:bifunctional 5,10-methylenetetrahydrofolate dehydrogenase/5,10-methenyltetrahydrofolate cyclohydrolase [Candidatus Uhrbacteria bacterium]
MMATILDGRALAARIREKIKTRVAALPSKPGLAVILVGNDPASHLYVSLKQQACEEAGILFELNLYPSNTSQEDLIAKIEELDQREDIHGILVQLPLPSQNADQVIASINPLKDVDGFHPENLKRLREGKPAIASAVALGVMKLIDEAKAHGTACTVSSPLFAAPLQILLKERGIISTVTQAENQDLAQRVQEADILIVAEGIPGLITGTMVKPGATVIDVGTTRTDEGLKGDVDFESVEKVAGAITPVPGGVGPMTVAMLLVNILKAYDLQRTV